MTLEAYRHWLNVARRHARVPGEAEDLLQDALLVAAERGRLGLADEERAWLAGVIRNLAAMQARTAVRRKAREGTAAASRAGAPAALASAMEAPNGAGARSPLSSSGSFFATLPPAARRVAVLALHGLDRDEIRAALGLSDPALRQRLRVVRKALGALPDELRREALDAAQARRTARGTGEVLDLPLGLVRQALLCRLRFADAGAPPDIGAHDPDGHLFVVAPRSQNAEQRQQ